ncbi:IclR family transcriptional regulator [Propionicicella superfundia]|uniref:IclR family transcriptional regulator n=1 Tax=Propionicicella superfundia TaxID=348582 RepID=UPI000420C083|nr:IclR family transcriptional regulator [Propionicicella superfundia]
MSGERVSSLDKALQLLFALRGDHASARAVGDLARETALDKAQVSRYLQTFNKYGLVERLPGRQGYRLGWGLVLLSQHAFMAQVLQVVHPRIRRLSADVEESVFFSVRDGSQAVTLTSAEPERRLYARSWNGRPFSLIGSGVGYVLLAECTEDEVRAIWETDGEAHSLDRVVTGVREAKQQGFSVVRNEFSEGVSAIAFPVRLGSAERSPLVGVVSVSAPSGRFERELTTIEGALRQVAEQLTVELADAAS